MDHCPSTEQLRRALDEQLEGEERSAFEDHIEHCPDCQERLARLTDDDTIREWRGLLWRDGGRQAVPSPLLARLGEGGTPSPPVDSLGTVGPYELLSKLGSGASGVVYLARGPQHVRHVALKVLYPHLAANFHARARFEREARLASSLRHEHLVAVLAVGDPSTSTIPFLAMEYVAGGSLADLLSGKAEIAVHDRIEIVRQAALGLACAHERGLVHRDLKPSNILLSEDGTVAKVGDFGIARVAVDSDETTNGRFTRSGQVLGTPSYMSAEQIQSPDRVDARSDVYSLGVVLYELLTGEPPFRGEPLAVMRQVIDRDPTQPRVLNAKVSRQLETVTLKCLEKDPANRYQRAVELASDLERWLGGTPIWARPPSSWRRARTWVRKRPALASLLAVGSAALLAIIFTVTIYSARLQRSVVELEAAVRDADSAHADKDTLLQEAGIATAAEVMARSPEAAGAALVRVPGDRRGWDWHRLALEYAQSPRPAEIVGTHDWGVLSCLVGTDGCTTVTSGLDGCVVLRNTQSRRETELATGTWLEDNGCWDLAASPLEGGAPGEYYTRLCWVERDRLVAGVSARGKLVTWDLRTGARRMILTQDRTLNAVAATRDGRRLLAGDDRGLVVLVERDGGGSRRFDRLVGSPTMDVCRLGDAGWIIGQADGLVTLLDPDLTRVLGSLRVAAPVWDIDAVADGARVVIACGEPSIRVFKAFKDGRGLEEDGSTPLPRSTDHDPRAIHAVRFAPDARAIFAADDLGRLISWRGGGDEPRILHYDQRMMMLSQDFVDRLPMPLRRRCADIAFTPDGSSLYTAGLDATVKRWIIRSSSGVTEFQVGAKPVLRFDPHDPAMMWVGTSDGRLALRDSRTGEIRDAISAHKGAVTGIATAKIRRIVTCGEDGMVRFWREEGQHVRAEGRPISHGRALRSVDLSPDGNRAVAYDAGENVVLWDVASGQELGRLAPSNLGKGKAVGGLVAFNADGSVVAALSIGQSCQLLSGASLATIKEIGIVAGKGGTALAWHPVDRELLIAGDTSGRVDLAPRLSRIWQLPPELPNRVVGLSSTPDGTRFASAASDGTVFITDPLWVNRLLTLNGGHADATDLRFDPAGRRLALVHGDGVVKIWESAPPANPEGLKPLRKWRQDVLANDKPWSVETFRVGATALDRDDHLAILYLRRDDGRTGTKRYSVCLGRETGAGFEERSLETRDGNEPFNARSLALIIDKKTLHAAFRRNTERYAGQLLLSTHRPWPPPRGIDRSGGTLTELFEEPANWGIYNRLIPGESDQPTAFHFSYDGHRLLRTDWSEGTWTTKTLGRMGDGGEVQAVRRVDGSVHIVFRSMRYNSEPRSLVYLSGDGKKREIIDASLAPFPPVHRDSDESLAVTPGGDLVVLHTVFGDDGHPVVVLFRRSSNGWVRHATLTPSVQCVSNLTCDRAGRFRFVFTDEERGRLGLATLRPGRKQWDLETVWNSSHEEGIARTRPRTRSAALLIDSKDRPVIVHGCRLGDRAVVRVLRPLE